MKYLFTLLSLLFLTAQAQFGPNPAQMSLHHEQQNIKAGDSFSIAVQAKIEKGWYIYWKKSGGFSGPTSFQNFTLPKGVSLKSIDYPAPHYKFDEVLAPDGGSYYTKEEAIYILNFQTDKSLAEGQHEIKFNMDWQVCEVSCIPGNKDLSTSIKIAGESLSNAEATELFKRARLKAPKALPKDIRVHSTKVDRVLKISAQIPSTYQVQKVIFYPDHDALHSQNKIDFTNKDNTWSFDYKAAEDEKFPNTVDGVLTITAKDGSENHFKVTTEESTATAAPAKAETKASSTSLWKAILLAIGGGLILNLMPCVFPVISLKVMGFVKQSQEGQGKAWVHAAAFASGVILSFEALAGTLLFLRSRGSSVNWGDQLSNPYVVYTIIAVLFVIGLNLFGLFEIGVGLTGAGQGVKKSGLKGSFMSGVFATIVATPCMAPMLGSALIFAFTQPPIYAIIIFFFIAFGMSLPYILLASYPPLMKMMPKPGAWMETFKKSMGFLMILPAIWLLDTLNAQIGFESLLNILYAFVFLSVGLWLYGKYSPVYIEKKPRLIGTGLALIITITALFFSFSSIKGAKKMEWQKWSKAAVEEAISEGRPIFIDFTAKWCATCQVNKKLAIYPAEKAFTKKNVLLLRADKTLPNAIINKELERFGSIGVPMNLLYLPGEEEPYKFPETFTQDHLEKKLQEIK